MSLLLDDSFPKVDISDPAAQRGVTGILEDVGAIAPRKSGFSAGVREGFRDLGASYVATGEFFGIPGASDLRKAQDVRKEVLRSRQAADDPMSKLAYSIGQGVANTSDIALAIGATALTGGASAAARAGGGLLAMTARANRAARAARGAMMLNTAARTLGRNALEAEQQGLKGGTALASTLLKTAISVGTEQIGGPQSMMSHYVRGTFARALQEGGETAGKTLLKTAVKAARTPSTYLTKVLGGVIEEGPIEESLDALGSAAVDKLTTGKWSLQPQDLLKVAGQASLQSIIPVMIGAGFQQVGESARKDFDSALEKPVDAAARQLAYSKDGVLTDSSEMDINMRALDGVLAKRFEDQDRKEALYLIRNASEQMASIDPGKLPQDFVATIAVAFDRGEVDLKAFREAKTTGEKLAVLRKAPGFGGEYYRLTERVAALRMLDDNDAREKEIFSETEAQVAARLNNAVEVPQDGSPAIAVHAFDTVDQKTFADVYRRGAVRGIKLGGKTYTVYARGFAALHSGATFRVKDGDLVFVESEETPRAVADIDRNHEAIRMVMLDSAESVDPDAAYRARRAEVFGRVRAEEMGKREVVRVLKDALIERQRADKEARLQEIMSAPTPEQRLGELQAEQARIAEERKAYAESVRAAEEARQNAMPDEDRIALTAKMAQEQDAEAKRVSRQSEIESLMAEAEQEAEAEKAVKLPQASDLATRGIAIAELRDVARRIGVKPAEVMALPPDLQERLLGDEEAVQTLSAIAVARPKGQSLVEAARGLPEPVVEKNPFRKEKSRRRLEKRLGVDRGLFSEEGEVPRAWYSVEDKALRFLNEATADDIVHEWFHHITETTDMMPSALRDILLDHYGDADRKFDGERAVNGFLKYIQTRQLDEKDSPSLRWAFDWMRTVMAGSAQAAAGVVNDETLTAFDIMFGRETPDQAASATGRAILTRSMHAKSEEIPQEPVDPTEPKFSLGGLRARTANVGMAERAEQMERELVEPDMSIAEKEAAWSRIAAETGWHRVVEGEKMMFEVDDSKMLLMADSAKDVRGKTLDDVLDYEDLFLAYPQLRKLKIGHTVTGEGGSYTAGTIFVGANVGKTYLPKLLVHEIQHAIQEIEGFGRGGSIDYRGPLIGMSDSEQANAIAAELFKIREQHPQTDEILLRKLTHSMRWPGVNPSQEVRQMAWDLFQKGERGSSEMRRELGARRVYSLLTGEALARVAARRLDMTPDQRAAESPRETLKKMLRKEGLMREGQSPEDVLITRGVRNAIQERQAEAVSGLEASEHLSQMEEEVWEEGEEGVRFSAEPRRLAVFVGNQDDGEGGTIPLYNVPNERGEMTTVTAETARKMGFEIPGDEELVGTRGDGKVSAEQDRAYLAAVERGDNGNDPLPTKATAEQDKAWLERNPKSAAVMQKRVNEAAKKAGYNVGPVWHGTDPETTFSEFRPSRTGAIWFTENRGYASFHSLDTYERGDEKVMRVSLNVRNPLDLRQKGGNQWDAIRDNPDIIAAAKRDGHDGIILNDDTSGIKGVSWVAFYPSQIKSADPITRDDQGRVIPPSERFNEKTPDIRFSAEPRRNPLHVPPADLTPQDIGALRSGLTVKRWARIRGIHPTEAHKAVREMAVRMFDIEPGEDGKVLSLLSGEQLQELARYIRGQAISIKKQAWDQMSLLHFKVPYDALNRPEDKAIARRMADAAMKASKAAALPPETAENKQQIAAQAEREAQALRTDLSTRPRERSEWLKGIAGRGATGWAVNQLELAKRLAREAWGAVKRHYVMPSMDINSVLTILSGGRADSPFATFNQRLYQANRALVQRSEATIKFLDTLLKKHGIASMPAAVQGMVVLDGTPYQKEAALGLALIGRGNVQIGKDGRFEAQATESLFLSNGSQLAQGDRSKFARMLSDAYALTRKDAQLGGLMAAMDEFFAKALVDINTKRAEMGQAPIGKIDLYFPMMHEGGMFHEDDRLGGALGITPSKVVAMNPEFASAKSRGNAGGRPVRLDAVDVFNNYRRQMDIFLAKEEHIAYLKKVLKGAEVAFVEAGMQDEFKTLATMLEAERHFNGRVTPYDDLELMVKGISQRSKSYAILANVPSILSQLISLPTGMAELPGLMPIKAAANLARVLGKLHVSLHQKLDAMNILSNDPTWRMMRDGGSKHAMSRNYLIETSSETEVPTKTRETLMLPMRALDLVVRVAIWKTGYDAKYDEMLRKGATKAQAHDIAFRDAEALTDLTQSPASQGELSLMQSQSEWSKALVPFTGAFFKLWNYTYTQMAAPLKRAIVEGRKDGGGWGAMREAFEVIYGTKYAKDRYGVRTGLGRKAVFTYVLPAMAMYMITNGRPPEDEEEFWTALLAYNVTMLPIVGPALSNAIINSEWRRDQSPIYMGIFNDLKEVVRNLKNGKTEEAKRAGTNLTFRTFGLPAKVLKLARGVMGDEYVKGKDFDALLFWKKGVAGWK